MNNRTMLRYAAAVYFAVAGVSSWAQGGSEASAAQIAPAAPAAAASAPTDRALAANVRGALRAARKQGLKSTFIRVRAHNGAITLSGVVASESQIALATSVAQSVSGVQSVTSKIEVRSNAGIKGSQ
ncbi:BON domain-containing protein [Paraburkholderia flagellata]|uniref:BON domain-containing protein n=1 Tax=Paraburkholderia flagellata TaxID=2883241 RepID=UPI001F16B4A7|nr:BON domain-containing protein [Paraburkholderia flagellata]